MLPSESISICIYIDMYIYIYKGVGYLRGAGLMTDCMRVTGLIGYFNWLEET